MGDGVLCLDFDPKSDGFRSRDLLEDRFRPLPETARALTGIHQGVRGEHLFYTYDPKLVVKSRPLANALGGRYPGVDVKADGGMVVLPPTLHHSGVRYEWQLGLDEIAPAPAWLLALLAGGSRSRKSSRVAKRRRARVKVYGQIERWVYGDEGIPSPQWDKIARITYALWDDPSGLTAEEITDLVYEALTRSPDYDPDRPWSRSDRLADTRRLLSKAVGR
jgi:hypothetical protein